METKLGAIGREIGVFREAEILYNPPLTILVRTNRPSRSSKQEGLDIMWSRTYRNHCIMAFPSFNAATQTWRAQADISWCAGNRRHSQFVRYRRYSMTEKEAVDLALQQSIKWVDGRLTLER